MNRLSLFTVVFVVSSFVLMMVDGQTASTAVTTTAIVLPVEQATTAAQRDAFLGTYTPSSGCVASSTCCCSTGPVTVTAGTASNMLSLAGSTDGGAGCMSQTSLAGAFTMYQPNAAYSYISFVPVLIVLESDSTHQWLQMNSTKTNCNNVFQRSVGGSTTTPPVTTTTPPVTTTTPPTGTFTPPASTSSPFPAFNASALPTFGSNPFGSQNSSLPTLPGGSPFGQLPGTGTSTVIPPSSTNTPFNTQLPLPGQSPFDTNALQAIQLPGGTGSTSTPTLPTGAPGSVPTTLPPFGQLPGTTPTATGFSTSSTNTTTGVAYNQQLVEATGTNASVNTKNYLAAFTTPATSNVKFVILHYYTLSDIRQKNVFMNLTSSAGLAQQLIQTAQSPIITPTQNYYVFVHGPIKLADSDSLTYSYTYSTQSDGSKASNTPSYTYTPKTTTAVASSVTVPNDALAALPGMIIADPTAPTSNTTATINMNSSWNGRFQSDASCVPSDTCCCGVGIMNVSTMTDDPTHVLITGALDGGAGCLYQTSLTGLMLINSTNANRASRSIEIPNAEKTVITFTAEMSTPTSTSSAASVPQLRISNTFRPCQTIANKISSYTGDKTPGDNTTTPNIDLSTNSTSPRNAFLGDYDFDSSCVPSDSCCCAQGLLTIAPVYDWTPSPVTPPAMAALGGGAAQNRSTNHTNEILFSAILDGGSACVGMKNVSQIFTLTSPTAAAFNFPPVKLNADLSSSSPTSVMDTMIFKNSMYPSCTSQAKKRSTFTIVNADNSTTTVTNATSTKPTSTTNTNTTTQLPTTPTQMNDTQLTAVRDSYLGEYDSSECVVSTSCCCASGVTRITSNSSSLRLVNVATTLTGSQFSCLQKDGPITMTFSIINSTSAESSPFVGQNIQFTATQSAEDHQKIRVSNSVHPLCPTILIKRPSNAASAVSIHDQSISSISTNSIKLGITTLIASAGIILAL